MSDPPHQNPPLMAPLRSFLLDAVLLPDCGHAPQRNQPQAVIAATLNLLASLPVPKPPRPP